jgi:hypothetical protein
VPACHSYLLSVLSAKRTLRLFFRVVVGTAGVVVLYASIALLPGPLPFRRGILSYCDLALGDVSFSLLQGCSCTSLLFVCPSDRTCTSGGLPDSLSCGKQ